MSDERFYFCVYREPYTGLNYCVHVRATGPKHLRSILDTIDLDIECPDGCYTNGPSVNRLYTWAHKREPNFERQLPRVLHHVTFIGSLVCRLNTAPHPGIMLSDSRCVHAIAHRMEFGFENEPNCYDQSTTRDAIVTDVSHLELHVPWLFPERQLGD